MLISLKSTPPPPSVFSPFHLLGAVLFLLRCSVVLCRKCKCELCEGIARQCCCRHRAGRSGEWFCSAGLLLLCNSVCRAIFWRVEHRSDPLCKWEEDEESKSREERTRGEGARSRARAACENCAFPSHLICEFNLAGEAGKNESAQVMQVNIARSEDERGSCLPLRALGHVSIAVICVSAPKLRCRDERSISELVSHSFVPLKRFHWHCF